MKTFGHVKFLTQGGGFFSNFCSVMSMVIDCHNRGIQPYVDLRRTSFVEGYNPYFDEVPVNPDNPWDWWFDQEQPSSEDTLVEVEFAPTKNFAHDVHVWKREDIPFARMVFDKYLHIKPHIIDRANKYYNESLKGYVVLGVMARGGEFNTYHPEFGKHNINSWIDGISKMVKRYPDINKVFLVTEDNTYIQPICDAYPNTVYLDVFRRTKESLSFMINTPLWPSMNSPRPDHCRLLGEECLIQALLLGMCDYMCVKQCGTANGAVFLANENLKDVYYLT